MAAFDAILDDLAERVAERVLARLGATTTHYGTGRAATLPPGKSRAWALRNLKTISGAKKIGRDWVIEVAAYEAWANERDSARFSTAPQPANDVPDVEALAEQALSGAGYRRTRAAR